MRSTDLPPDPLYIGLDHVALDPLPTPAELLYRRFPLTKTLDPADYLQLAEELAQIAQVGVAGQASDHRAWEYAMALRAIRRWLPDYQPAAPDPRDHPHPALTLVDVGGAGSPLCRIITQAYPTILGEVRDPSLNTTVEFHVEQHPTAQASADLVTVISVLEHVKGWRPFLRACAALLAPGGLLVLTTDYWDAQGPDTAHFHWMRERIYNRETITDVQQLCREIGLDRFGLADWVYRGNHCYGEYSFLAMALVKTRGAA